MKKLIQKIEIRGYERSPDVKKSASMNTVQIKSRQHLKGEKFLPHHEKIMKIYIT